MFFPTAPCQDPGVPRQGNRTGDDFRHDSKVIFTCPNNYLMEGVGEMSCSNGTWSNRVPTCKGEGLHDTYSLHHRKCGVRGYMHELFVSKTRTSEVRASEGF